MTHSARIALVISDLERAIPLQLRLQSKGYQTATFSCITSSLGLFYADPPDLLVIDLTSGADICTSIVSSLRSDSFFSAIPILGLIAPTESDTLDWDFIPIDDFIRLPVDYHELFLRISLCLSRIKRIFDNNPLTRLPGNTSIQRAIEEGMGRADAVCYADISHFKPYNDAYGFSHGDEVIRMLARIMFNAVRDSGGGFCGHIGGDDFVFILPTERSEPVCRTIISYFDQIVLDLFDEETRKNGYYVAKNRKGDVENIPLLSVSIAIVPLDSPTIQHVAKVAEVAAELKKLAKDSGKSCYVRDQRRQ